MLGRAKHFARSLGFLPEAQIKSGGHRSTSFFKLDNTSWELHFSRTVSSDTKFCFLYFFKNVIDFLLTCQI